MASYTYNPAGITDKGIDQMRFELADTEVDGGKNTCALCDEEYKALIEKYAQTDSRGWFSAKYQCLHAIMMRFSVEVDFSAGGGNVALSQRYERWKELYFMMQKSLSVPTANPAAMNGDDYFYFGMQGNPAGGNGWPFGVPDRRVGAGTDG